MHDMDRKELVRFVFDRMVDPDFRERLVATAPDGGHPVLAALTDDTMKVVLNQIECVGGAGNVVVPWKNGVVVITVTGGHTVDDDEPLTDDHCPDVIDGDCTVGVFLARMSMESASIFRFARMKGQPEGLGRAELVALAG